jgi:hypothetical protein
MVIQTEAQGCCTIRDTTGGSFGAVLNGSDRQQIRLYDCSDRPAVDAERVLLDYIQNDLLSPEIVELAVAEYRAEAKKLRRARPRAKPPTEVAQSVARIEHEIEQLKQMIRAGTMTAATLRPAIDAAETERAWLLTQVETTLDLDVEKVARLLPDAVGAYRTKVGRLSDGRGTLSSSWARI